MAFPNFQCKKLVQVTFILAAGMPRQHLTTSKRRIND
jgi:hypothetical protein